ncbi:hypothetical protein [Pseudoduganella rivuli]|uniref:hypothetical protein n=1 Tax=Pseudoduganella rivuli TaxID=2666085 RepID=UPI0018A1CAC2|nr:hypothetical protein [Pseudoduganella rivuli]
MSVSTLTVFPKIIRVVLIALTQLGKFEMGAEEIHSRQSGMEDFATRSGEIRNLAHLADAYDFAIVPRSGGQNSLRSGACEASGSTMRHCRA